MNSVLQNASSLFGKQQGRDELLTWLRFLTDQAFRDEFLKTVQDQAIVNYWQRSFPH